MNEAAKLLANKGMLVDPAEYFKGKYEVERKFRVPDLEPVRAKLLELGAIAFTIGNSESDVFFDTTDGRLASNNQYQTLRHMRPSGRVLWISKGPGIDECVAMDLTDYDKATAMLLSLGFVENNRIDKQRDIYFIEEFHATLDQVSGLGTFVEMAIMSDDKSELAAHRINIQTMAKKLGLLDDVEETLSYRQMLVEPKDMISDAK